MKKVTLLKGHSSLLSWKDSNPRKRNQNPMCYHYTTGQFLYCDCKGTAFFVTTKKNPHFFSIFPEKSHCHGLFRLLRQVRYPRYSKRMVAMGLIVEMMWLAPRSVR